MAPMVILSEKNNTLDNGHCVTVQGYLLVKMLS